MSLSRNQVNQWLKTIDITDKTVLDIGAGPKEKWTRKIVKGGPKEYKTADVDDTFGCDYVFDLNTVIPDLKKYEIVFCIETLEHCWNPVRALENLHSITQEACYIATPFINPHHDKWDYFRFTGEWYENVLRKVGFQKVKIVERVATKGKNLLEQFYKAEGLRVSKIRPEFGRYTYPIGYCVEAYR